MTPEQLAKELTGIEDVKILSVILYGSAAAGDHTGKKSDYNLLVIADSLGVKELTALSGLASRWARAGNPPPLLLTMDHLKNSADVFPIELLDMKDSRKVLAGVDVLSDLEVSSDNLRLQLEHELKSKLIRLREQYLLTRGKPKAVQDLLVGSLSTFLVLLRACLRLFEEKVPARKIDAPRTLEKHIHCAPELFEKIQSVKEGRTRLSPEETSKVFDRYLHVIEALTDAIDAWIHK